MYLFYENDYMTTNFYKYDIEILKNVHTSRYGYSSLLGCDLEVELNVKEKINHFLN